MTSRAPGFTLIETIFSTLFIGVTVLAIVNLFPGAYLSIRQSETRIQADVIAESVLDELRATVDLLNLPNGDYDAAGAPFEPVTVEGIVYTPNVTFSDVPGMESKSGSLRKVTVTVTYRLQLSEKTVVHETYFHQMTLKKPGPFQ